MGGTSCDITFIEGGEPLETTESVIARRPMQVPALDITSISAGGGSVAAVDSGGFLNVGLRSAGAVPGPACYGRGGADPTVTDADLVCGVLDPAYFLGGTQRLDPAAAWSTIEAKIARPLGMGVRAAAAGIRRIVDIRMADEVRVIAAKRGTDISAFTLLPFGGAGAVHAAAVAAELGMRRILVPPWPGAFSALGLLCTDVVHDYVRSELRPLAKVAPAHAEALFGELETRARADLAAEGLGASPAQFVREFDLRYVGQGYELRVAVDNTPAGGLDAAALAAVRVRFDERHARIHGHAAREKPVEIVSYRLRVRVAVPKYEPALAPSASAAPPPGDALKGRREIWFDGESANSSAVYERARLPVGATFAGPAIVEQFDATTVVPPGWTGEVDRNLYLVLTRAN
jgi:N-methylhydantoinase A